METFFTILRKGVIATMAVMFAVVVLYTPQDWNKVEHAEAGGGLATERTQWLNRLQLGGINANSSATAASTAATAISSGSLVTKEYILDGIGWMIAKQVVSAMVQSLIDWINSGFQGSPAFITDLKGFLLNVADEAIGTYINELGGIGSFICSPFRLDVQVSVALTYAQARSNGGNGTPAPTCTLSGIIDNIEGFIQGSFSEGGWNDWFEISAKPEVYTPYGAILTAQAEARARIINAKGQEIKLLDWGDGFLSGKSCQSVSDGSGGSSQQCAITKPGKIIQEALTFNLQTGPRSLIEADEINEVIAALLGQLAQQAITGINGLLGLSSGTGFTDYNFDGFTSGSYLDSMNDQSGANTGSTTESVVNLMEDALDVQQQFNAQAQEYLPRLEDAAIAPPFIGRPDDIARAEAAVEYAREVIATTDATIGLLEGSTTTPGLITRATDPTATSNDILEVYNTYQALDLYTMNEMIAAIAAWDAIIDAAEGTN